MGNKLWEPLVCMGVGGCLLEEFVEVCVEGWVLTYDGLDDVALWVDDDLGWETFDGVLGWDIRGAWTIDVLPRKFVLLYGCWRFYKKRKKLKEEQKIFEG